MSLQENTCNLDQCIFYVCSQSTWCLVWRFFMRMVRGVEFFQFTLYVSQLWVLTVHHHHSGSVFSHLGKVHPNVFVPLMVGLSLMNMRCQIRIPLYLTSAQCLEFVHKEWLFRWLFNWMESMHPIQSHLYTYTTVLHPSVFLGTFL